jgi:transposase
MSTHVPNPAAESVPAPADPRAAAAALADPFVAAVPIPVARVPVSALHAGSAPTAAPPVETPAPAAAPAVGPAPPLDTAALPDDPGVLKQMIVELLRALRCERRDRQELQQRLDALLRRLHGPRPGAVSPDQPSLFPEADEAPHVPPPTAAAEERRRRRGHCRPHGRRRAAPRLRRQPQRYELTGPERLCPECGCDRREFGVETTEQYDYKPAEVFVVEHQRVKYVCPCCEGQVVLAPKPPQPIDKGLPGPGLLAQVVVDKYLDHIPLHRSEQRFARLGADFPRSTMCDWMAACAMLLTPLWLLLKEHVLRTKVLHTDDTTVPVRDEQLRKHRYGRLWVYIRHDAQPSIVFDYTATHARDGPAEFLKEFRGFLQADAYGAYDGIYTGSNGAIVEVGCWAHARNKFAEAASTDPERVLAAKAWVRRLYDVEDEAKAEITRHGLTGAAAAAVFLRLRQAKAAPLLTSFGQWLLAQKEKVLPKSPIAAAINYVRNQWAALSRYTTDGDLHIDNNVSERTLKLIGMGRDNWLFVGSDAGGQTAAVLFSFTATCKLLRLDAFAYLRDVLGRLPTQAPERLEELLPHRWQAAQAAALASAAAE